MADVNEYTDRLETILQELHTVKEQATAAHEEARGAHMQAKRTNGRVDRHDDRLANIDTTLHGPTDQGMDGDGGLVGYVRTQRRDQRLIGAWVVLGLPLVFAYLLAID